nr:nucleotidyltransferase domain-containing protein [Bacteroidota bacterium]
MNAKTSHIGQLIRQSITSIDPLAEVFLYGSRARGDERADSDWDILVLTTNPIDLNIEKEFRGKLYDLELETGEPFSMFIYTKNDWLTKQRITPFYQNVIKEGVRL